MFLDYHLKDQIVLNSNFVECPVDGCHYLVERQIGSFKKSSEFLCPHHSIYISPSTYEYEDMRDNLLWKDPTEIELLQRILQVKRVNRIGRERSEDAVIWNIFRYLKRNAKLDSFIGSLLQTNIEVNTMYYWGYDELKGTIWQPLNEVRSILDEFIITEPDILLETNDTLILLNGNVHGNISIKPNSSKLIQPYLHQLEHNDLFKTSIDMISFLTKHYNLAKLWFLGNYLSRFNKKKFIFITIYNESRSNVMRMNDFQNTCITINGNQQFLPVTWSTFHSHLVQLESDEEFGILENYLLHKTFGYQNGKLKRAFPTLVTN
ncbi:hypothetical protein Q73_07005 [Bacillus coahuilensis m2-6]|uniref:hypothetical protein n=1 Tax=Bacillus coahuilensis TaxID=408580 RepID=UPI00075046D1|nr:hypothetical protein [Bacillus coahuilensis]KUP08257.1 hypothetical protein Q73_07005 [Bacillus coahuilensis m2-6]